MLIKILQGKLFEPLSKEAAKIFQNTSGSKGTNRTNDFAVNYHIQEKYADRRISKRRKECIGENQRMNTRSVDLIWERDLKTNNRKLWRMLGKIFHPFFGLTVSIADDCRMDDS